MIDTIGFKIPIDNATHGNLSTQMTMTQRIDKKTGYIEFEYLNSKLDFSCPSWQYRVIFKIGDEIWAYHKASKQPYKAEGFPHISIEYSVPKILTGNNLITGLNH